MISLLAPLFAGEWSLLGENLACSPRPPVAAVAVADLLREPALLDRLLQLRAHQLGVEGGDLRAVASAWSLHYLWTLLPPVAAAASVLEHVFPVAAADMALEMDAAGLPVRFHISHEGMSAPGTDTLTRYDALLHRHLEPLFAVISHRAGLPRKILWGNAARYLEILLDQTLAQGAAATDKTMLLQNRTWPNGRRNPLHGPQRDSVIWVGGLYEPIKLYRQCCLNHLLPEESHCTACPLAPQHQLRVNTPAPSA